MIRLDTTELNCMPVSLIITFGEGKIGMGEGSNPEKQGIPPGNAGQTSWESKLGPAGPCMCTLFLFSACLVYFYKGRFGGVEWKKCRSP